jgi:hypothetical protein
MSLLLGTGLTTTLPGLDRHAASAEAASAEDEAQAAAMLESSPESDQLFRVEWKASPGGAGRSRITGYVYNSYGQTALNVQLRISEVDTAGHTISSVTGPMLDRVPGHSQAHFDVQVPGNGKSYGVAVASFSFDFADGGSRETRSR